MKITWDEYCKRVFIKEISKYGSIRKMEQNTGIDKAIICKIKNGKIIPTRNFLIKHLPDINIPIFTADISEEL